jgi:hypothetical protein
MIERSTANYTINLFYTYQEDVNFLYDSLMFDSSQRRGKCGA